MGSMKPHAGTLASFHAATHAEALYLLHAAASRCTTVVPLCDGPLAWQVQA